MKGKGPAALRVSSCRAATKTSTDPHFRDVPSLRSKHFFNNHLIPVSDLSRAHTQYWEARDNKTADSGNLTSAGNFP